MTEANNADLVPLASGPAPVVDKQRIGSIDVLRGVAVLGILALNIQSFAMVGAAYMNPTAYGDLTGANYTVWYLTHLLGDQKFMTIFSMLFGAGIVLMSERAEATGRGSVGVHYRRMGWLILFGLLHAHLLWYGDILYFYGMCGLVAWLFRRLHPALLIILGLVAVSVASLVSFGALLAPDGAMQDAQWAPGIELVTAELDAYRGSWLQQMAQRVPKAIVFETFMFAIWGAWRAGGLMLIGMALFKLGVFSARRSNAFYAVLVGLALFIALPTIVYEVRLHEAGGWEMMRSMFLYGQINYWASIVVSLGWVGLVMLVCRADALRWLTVPFAAAGRMALTNYLMQTIICTTLFYGHGLGYFGSFSRVEQLLTVVSIWIFQLIVSPIWLHFFRYGPFEWLWRSLTYLRLQPFVRRRTSSGASGETAA